MEISINLANKAASIAVQHPGTYTLTEEDCKNLQLFFNEQI
jgi:bifunctional ADP-heptose synthase (sugar kinase/adenylyltransferase)